MKKLIIFILCITEINAFAQMPQIDAAPINGWVNIHGLGWYVVKKKTMNGERYAMLLSDVPLVREVYFNHLTAAAPTNYENSNLQKAATSYYAHSGRTTWIKSVAVVPSLGNHSSMSAVSEPTATLAGRKTKDILFAPSYGDVYEWNGKKLTPFSMPLSQYGQNWWTRTVASSERVWDVHASFSPQEIATAFVQKSHAMNFVGAVWVICSRSPYQVIYNVNGGNGNPPGEEWELPGTSVTVASPGNLTKPGYAFGGWSDGVNTYQPNDTFIMPSHDVTLTAVWVRSSHNITGTVNGLPSNANINIYYTLNGGARQTTVTNAYGRYILSGVAENTAVTITSASVPGYTVLPAVHHFIMGQNSVSGKDFVYSEVNISINPPSNNPPANMIDDDVTCYQIMPANIAFGIREKFRTTTEIDDCIDGFTSPLVGDLNGDGKPEIVVAGVVNFFSFGARVNVRYINIYNGQTGARMYQHDLTEAYDMGDAFHRAPAQLALADLDEDGIGEIVLATNDGLVRTFKPVFNGASITGMNLMWTGHINGTPVDYAAPLTSSRTNYGYPHPYIADLNGDGTPEVIVYNKIFNGVTGDLLMSWQNAAPSFKYSSVASGVGGLANNTSTTPTEQTNANSIKNAAMTGRRMGNGLYSDNFLAVPAILDIDGDGQQEIVCGSRIHKFQFHSLTDHTQNTYTTIEGPATVTLSESPNSTTTTTHYLSDGFTRIADIDGDGKLDVIVVTVANSGSTDIKILIYVWDMDNLSQVKAAVTYRSHGTNGNFGIPFIGDINAKKDGWDGTGYRLKLPEICIVGGAAYINKSGLNEGRSGIKFHPVTDEKLRQGTAGNSGAAAGWDNNQATNPNRRFNRSMYGGGHILGLTYDAQATSIEERLKISWGMEHNDESSSTGITLFDFDNDDAQDLCYRDQSTLRMISPKRANGGTGSDYVTEDENETTPGTSIMFKTNVYSGTGFEYPTIADVNMDGSADIVVTQSSDSKSAAAAAGFILVFEHKGEKWSPCPPVWNQSMYDPTQVRNDLKINASPMSILTPFTKNNETIYPYNVSWVQQPIVKAGEDYVPVVRLPDAIVTNMVVTVQSTTATQIELTIRNIGSATVSASSPIAFYNNTIDNSTLIEAKEVGVDIFPNETVTLTYSLTGNFNNCLIWARIMDDGMDFPVTGHEDCDLDNNALSGIDCPYLHIKTVVSPSDTICGIGNRVRLSITDMNGNSFIFKHTPVFRWYKDDVLIPSATDSVLYVSLPGVYYCWVEDGICRNRTEADTIYLNPDCFSPGDLSALMKKNATLLLSPPIRNNGTYANPVAVLFNEVIEYEITAVNFNRNAGTVIIRDTLPLYMNYVPFSAAGGGTFVSGITAGRHPQDYVAWTFSNVAPMDTVTVHFNATPASGVCASQPFFINKAWITVRDTLHTPTGNKVYHQGAGVSILTFSSAVGGMIFNARTQAIDYKMYPAQGIIVAPDEGFIFTGWSHGEYRSLRGEIISAQSGILQYDTLTVYGDVNLRANFELEEYDITYFLNGGMNEENPSAYNIKSQAITLKEPVKANDIFIGWTGSNGDEPQKAVTIPKGSTGERVYYANYLHSGRDGNSATETPDKDRIWASKDKLYIYTSQAGSVVKIFTLDGLLYKLQTILSVGETGIKLPQGVYIVVLNNGTGKKIIVY